MAIQDQSTYPQNCATWPSLEVGGVGGASHYEHGVSVQARVYGQALDDEELFDIEGSPGAQLQKTGGARKMPSRQKTISDVIRAAC